MASYNGELLSGIEAEHRIILTASNISLPIQTVPIVLISEASTDSRDLLHSRFNPAQERLVLTIVENMHSILKNDTSVVILCFYLGTKRAIQNSIHLPSNCAIHTVDSYQGREADNVILITTRSAARIDEEQPNMEFFGNDKRITVALSRARHGLFIIANFNMLSNNELWNRYLTAATKFTPIVNSNYIHAMRNNSTRDSRGVLLDFNSKSLIVPSSYNHSWL